MAIADIRSAELEIPSRGPAGIPGPSGDQVNLDTRALIGITTIAPSAGFIRTAGKTAVGDGGGKVYARVVSEPAHADKAQSVDGAWWEGAQETEYEDVFLKHFLRRHDYREDGLREAFQGSPRSHRSTGYGSSATATSSDPPAVPDALRRWRLSRRQHH